MNVLEELIQLKGLSFSKAAKAIGISRMKLWEIRTGKPAGRNAARKINEWSNGIISVESIILGLPQSRIITTSDVQVKTSMPKRTSKVNHPKP